ncbi:MAG: chromosome segregation protein ScpA, partial [Edaphobacter sp.]
MTEEITNPDPMEQPETPANADALTSLGALADSEPFALEPRPIAPPAPEPKRPSAAKDEASQSP